MLASEMSGATPDYRVDAIIPLRNGDRSIAKIRVGPVAMTVFVVEQDQGGRVSWPRSAAGHDIATVPDKTLRTNIENEILATLHGSQVAS
jgi:hypothetical protein